jgi:hypothetical protein
VLKIIQFYQIQFKSCSLSFIFNSTSVIIKPEQEHKYSTRTMQIQNNETLNGQNKGNMAVEVIKELHK